MSGTTLKKLTGLAAASALLTGGLSTVAWAEPAETNAFKITDISTDIMEGPGAGYLENQCLYNFTYEGAAEAGEEKVKVELLDMMGDLVKTITTRVTLSESGLFSVFCGEIPANRNFNFRLRLGENVSETYRYSGNEPVWPGVGITQPVEVSKNNYVFPLGKKVTLTQTSSWEPGTKFDIRVWTSEKANFTNKDRNWNTSGKALVEVKGISDYRVSFTPKPREAGRYLWISAIARTPDSLPVYITYPVARLDDSRLKKSTHYTLGKKSGKAKVGKTIKVTAPKATKLGKAAGVKFSYKWHVKTPKGKYKPLTGAKSTKSKLKLTKKMKGKTYRVAVQVKAPNYTSPSRKTYTWSKTK